MEIDKILNKAKKWLDEKIITKREYNIVCALLLVDDRELTEKEYNFPENIIVENL